MDEEEGNIPVYCKGLSERGYATAMEQDGKLYCLKIDECTNGHCNLRKGPQKI